MCKILFQFTRSKLIFNLWHFLIIFFTYYICHGSVIRKNYIHSWQYKMFAYKISFWFCFTKKKLAIANICGIIKMIVWLILKRNFKLVLKKILISHKLCASSTRNLILEHLDILYIMCCIKWRRSCSHLHQGRSQSLTLFSRRSHSQVLPVMMPCQVAWRIQ